MRTFLLPALLLAITLAQVYQTQSQTSPTIDARLVSPIPSYCTAATLLADDGNCGGTYTPYCYQSFSQDLSKYPMQRETATSFRDCLNQCDNNTHCTSFSYHKTVPALNCFVFQDNGQFPDVKDDRGVDSGYLSLGSCTNPWGF